MNTSNQLPAFWVLWSATRMSQHDLFFGHGTDNSDAEACQLVAEVLSLSPFDFDAILESERTVSDEEGERIKHLTQLRIDSRKPLPYLTNKAYFAHYEFYVNENVLIPRSPIAELIMEHFQPHLNLDNCFQVLDMCTGSGCIGIAISLYHPWMSVDMVDVDEKALAVARRNIDAHELSDSVNLIQSDMFNSLEQNKQYDLIVSNPPYVSDEEMGTLPEEYGYEPVHALQADNKGLLFVDCLLKQSADFMSESGLLIVEVGNTMEQVCEAYPQVDFKWLNFVYGGHGVFILNKDDLLALQNA